jgi:O-antigen ligase
MQVTNTFGKGAFPPPGGGAPSTDIASQINQQRSYYQRIHFQRSLSFWWFRILLIVLAVIIAVTLGYVYSLFPLAIVLTSYKYVLVGAIAFPLIVFLVKRLDIALLFLAVSATPFLPQAFTLKSIPVFPCILMVFLLFCVLLVQVSFHVRKAFLPSLWILWPYMGMIALALISTIMVQFTWTHGVPKKINNNPIYYDEILGIGVYFFPLITYMVVTTILSYGEKLIQWILNIFLFAGFIATIVTFIEFRRVGGNISTFRFAEPHVLWMSLRAIAQLMVLGTIISYVRFIYPMPWRGRTRLPEFLQKLFLAALPFSYASSALGVIAVRVFFRRIFATDEFYISAGKMRTLYAILTVLQTVAIIVTLQNSWWVELGMSLVMITIIASFRLLIFYCALLVPFVPLLQLAFNKLQSLKADDFLRLIIWQDSLRVWSKQPLLGVGPGDFWAYDQIYTQLPRLYRNCNATGLCVAHNGYLQSLGEIGPLGLFFYIAASVVVIIISIQLYRRTKLVKIRKDNLLNSILQVLGLYEYSEVEQRNDRVLALVGLGLICGSMAADCFIGEFMLPPRQVSAFNVVPQVMVSWTVYALVMYKHKLWLTSRRALRIGKKKKLPDLGARAKSL